nr:GNAT family N-acetyltransferase [Anaeromonas frigoriresistens]
MLTEVQNSDYEEVRKLYFDEKVRKFLGGIVSNERYNSSFYNMITSDKNSFYWVVRLKNNSEFIGLVSLDKHHDGFSTEISYQFMPQYWGYGYAEEVIKRIINYAFDELNIKELVAETQSANRASCKLLKKLGMSLRQTVTRFGEKQHIFGIAKSTF